jgi:hypothetical protein
MSKAKKTAYAEKQRIVATTADARALTPLAEAAPAAAKKGKARKQSRGK